MLMLCVALAAIGVTAYVSGDELFISGANISISIVTLLLEITAGGFREENAFVTLRNVY